ncbi:MAG: hypothetical protein F6K28_36690 [Microcoleus sp. SIO2G3]|nr:hypothetical protein [Microcoleus sp. SIO2G3]
MSGARTLRAGSPVVHKRSHHTRQYYLQSLQDIAQDEELQYPVTRPLSQVAGAQLVQTSLVF